MRKICTIMVAAIGMLGVANHASADILQNIDYTGFLAHPNTEPSWPYRLGPEVLSNAVAATLPDENDVLQHQWVTQDIMIPVASARLQSITLVDLWWSWGPATLTINGASYNTATDIVFENYGYGVQAFQTYDLHNLNVTGPLHIELNGWGAYGTTNVSSYAGSALMTRAQVGPDYADDLSTLRTQSAGQALAFSLNYVPAAPVPEPAAYLMLLAGAALVAGLRRGKRA